MALQIALIEGFDMYSEAGYLQNASGVSWPSITGWAVARPGRLDSTVKGAIYGPPGTGTPLTMLANRHKTGASLTNTYILNASFRPNLASGGRRIRFTDSSDVAHVDIEITSAGGFVAKNGDGTTLETGTTGVVSDDLWGTLQIKVVIDDAAGVVDVRWNGVQRINVSGGDTQNGGTAEVGKIVFTPNGQLDDVVGFIAASSDSIPLPRKVVLRQPASDGATTNFSPSTGAVNAAMVDDADPGGISQGFDRDATFNASSTPTDKDLFNLAALNGTNNIDGVRAILLARKTDVGVRRAKIIYNDGVSSEVESSEFDLNTAYLFFDDMQEAKPATGSWDEASFDGCDFGYTLST